MAGKNKSILLIGLVCIVFAFLCALALLYFYGQTSEENNRRLASLEVQLANLIAVRADEQLSSTDAARVRREPILLSDITGKAEKIYGEEEFSRTEGVLWIDRKAAAALITLGAVNGVSVGNVIDVFDGDAKVGSVSVEFAFDIVSYVQPIGFSFDDLTNTYYRVVVSQP